MELKARRLRLFEFIQPICYKWHRDGAVQLCSMTGKDIQAWWRSICVNYFWLKRTLWGVKFHSAVCWFSSAGIKEYWALNAFHAHNSFTTGWKRYDVGSLHRFSRCGNAPRRRAFTTQIPLILVQVILKDQSFIENQWDWHEFPYFSFSLSEGKYCAIYLKASK